MKRCLTIFVIAGAVSVSGCGGYAASTGGTQATSTQSAEPTSTGTATMAVDYPAYEDLTDLVDESKVVVQAVVVKSRVEKLDKLSAAEQGSTADPQSSLPSGTVDDIPATPGTLSTLRVTQVLLGDLSVGDKVDVLQTGGVSDGVKFVDPEQNILVPGQPETLMFLEKFDSSPWYLLLNSTQATYTVLPDGKLKTDNKNNKLDITKIEQVKEKIKEKKAKK